MDYTATTLSKSDLSSTKKPSKYWDVLIIIIFVILLGIFLAVIFYFSPDTRESVEIVRINNYGVNEQRPWGASANGIFNYQNGVDINELNICEFNPHAEWNETRCDCVVPFFGSACQYQSYNQTYREIGPVNRRQWQLNQGKIYNTDWLSFPSPNEESCTQICDQDSDCAGVLWTVGENKCQILHSPPSLVQNAIPEYSTALIPGEERMFLRNQGFPDLSDRVIISRGKPLWRPWLVRRTNNEWFSVQTIFPRQTVAISWMPEQAINQGGMIGLYSRFPLTLNRTPNGVQGQDWIILYPEGSFNILPEWETYYIIYYSLTQFPIFIS